MINYCKNVYKKTSEEDGVTLVELLAAIAILSIIVTSFLGFFIQAARTNNRTSDLNEATFIAQEELEYYTYLSNNYSLVDAVKEINEDKSVSVDGQSNFQISGIKNRTSYRVTFTALDDFSTEYARMYSVKVQATLNDSEAVMEARLPFELEPEPEGDANDE